MFLISSINKQQTQLREIKSQVQAAQAAWDAIPADDPSKQQGSPDYRPRPEDITLEE